MGGSARHLTERVSKGTLRVCLSEAGFALDLWTRSREEAGVILAGRFTKSHSKGEGKEVRPSVSLVEKQWPLARMSAVLCLDNILVSELRHYRGVLVLP